MLHIRWGSPNKGHSMFIWSSKTNNCRISRKPPYYKLWTTLILRFKMHYLIDVFLRLKWLILKVGYPSFPCGSDPERIDILIQVTYQGQFPYYSKIQEIPDSKKLIPLFQVINSLIPSNKSLLPILPYWRILDPNYL